MDSTYTQNENCRKKYFVEYFHFFGSNLKNQQKKTNCCEIPSHTYQRIFSSARRQQKKGFAKCYSSQKHLSKSGHYSNA